MKKFILISLFMVLVCCFSACTGDKVDDMAAIDDAYESMSCAIENGDYNSAMEYYNNGASDSGNENAITLYYQALAMKGFAEKGCIGYSYDLITDKSEGAYELQKKLNGHIAEFDGAYQSGSYFYVYFSDGKIAGKEGGQLQGETYCTGELVLIDNVYYWAKHNDSGADTLLYSVAKTSAGIKLTAVDSTNNIFEGEYESFNAEMPGLKY